MKNNLKTKPNLEWIINQPRTKERIDDAYVTIVDMKHWIEDFEKELRKILQQKEEDVRYSSNFTSFEKQEFLGKIHLIEEILGKDKE